VLATDFQLTSEPEADGKWRGVIGYLQRREGDITVIGINVASYYSDVIDTTIGFITYKPNDTTSPYGYAL
jgi:hypothetical protein